MKAEIANFNILVEIRSHFAWFLFAVVAILYYTLMLLIGLAPEFLGLKIGSNPVSLAIIIGIFIIVTCVSLTGIYTYVANTFLDREFAGAIDRLEKAGLINEDGALKKDDK
ncbi:DUF485 domain-containing protein [Campylobacter fetus subsp. venerealis]|uniref:DUF485 domain-containing protein n=1 Tax=Campylobacter fetus TaxID=196 RepID=UPI0018E78635|nr:DUF485 domain-containing protein [Campylobacter fetus]QQF52041.1 DUF485 domain-containing protein [Campylobacter fetus subsp. venerealis]